MARPPSPRSSEHYVERRLTKGRNRLTRQRAHAR
jgi:hypothetical protein